MYVRVHVYPPFRHDSPRFDLRSYDASRQSVIREATRPRWMDGVLYVHIDITLSAENSRKRKRVRDAKEDISYTERDIDIARRRQSVRFSYPFNRKIWLP